MRLLRNCWHGSEICTFVELSASSPQALIKSSSRAGGIADLKQELQGWNWYEKTLFPELHEKICTTEVDKESYFRLRIRWLPGKKPVYQNGFNGNQHAIETCIRWYQENWPQGENSLIALHGDLSLDNLMFLGDELYILDWEHFHIGKLPWGYDLIYLITETLYFSYARDNSAKSPYWDYASGLVNSLARDKRFGSEMLRQPTEYIRAFIRENSEIWGSQQKTFPGKFPVTSLSENQVRDIDKRIGC